MISITKKQVSIALAITAFAAIMIAGTVAASADNAFARHGFFNFDNFGNFGHHNQGKHSSTHQSISQGCDQNQHSTVITAGAGSPITASGNNAAACANVNTGGNAAATDQSGH